MKKVIIAVCLVGVAVVAAQAQGIARLANQEAKDYQRSKQKANNVSAAVDRAAIQARRAYEEKLRKQQKQTSAQQATVPGFGTTALINAEGAAATARMAKPAKAKKPAAKKKAQKKSNASVWTYVKAAFGCGPYPEETEAQYRARVCNMGGIANQPFK